MSKRAADHAQLLAGIEAQRVVPLKEAARLAGVSIDTLRKHYRNLIVKSRAEKSWHAAGRRARDRPGRLRLELLKAGGSAATSPNPNQQRQSAHFQRTGGIRQRVIVK